MALRVNGNAGDLATILKLTNAPLQARLLPTLATAARVRNVRPAGDLTADLRPLFENQNPDLRAAALKLAGVWKLDAFRATVETTAPDKQASDNLRRAAVEALAAFGGDASRKIVSGLAGDGATSVSSAAIAALCSFDLTEAASKAAALLYGVGGLVVRR